MPFKIIQRMVLFMEPVTVRAGPMTCTVDKNAITCDQQGTLPTIMDEKSFVKMLDTCYSIPEGSDDDAVNEIACETYSVNMYKKNFLKPPSLQVTMPCKWVPGRAAMKRKPPAFGRCTGDADDLRDLAFNVTYE